MKFAILNRFMNKPQFECELDAEFETVNHSVQLGAAVCLAVKARASLDGACLDGAILAGASLARASLDGACLDGAILAGASLDGASLARASLARASLAGASLAGASLDGACLDGACLDGAYLARASLAGASLDGASLDDRKLKLRGARPILQIGPLGSRCAYLIAYLTDLGVRVRAGCWFGSLDDFRAAVAATHGNNEHGREYAAAIKMIEAHAAIWKPKE